MSLYFLAFDQTTGFSDHWPMEVMSTLMGKMARANPKRTISDLPGPVALWWDRDNAPGHLTLETSEGKEDHLVKPGEVIWLQNKTTVSATLNTGEQVSTEVLANGEIKIISAKPSARRRAP